MQASQALIQMIEGVAPDLSSIDLFVADCGPGSFIGVRVAVTLAKSLAWAAGKECAAVSSFDLIDPASVVSFPSKRGEYYVRELDGKVTLASSPPEGSVGFGPDAVEPIYPEAKNAAILWDRLLPLDPALLLPNYILEPSISTPKSPYATA